MALTAWNPATKVSRGNIAIGIAEVVKNLDAPTDQELLQGYAIECAITDFKGESSTDSETVDWLCNPSSEQLPGSTTHEIDDLLIKSSGQDDDELLKALGVGDVIYLWRRDGLPHDKPLEAGQKVWVWRCVISSVDPAEASNTYIGLNAHVTAMARSRGPVAIVAAAAPATN